MAAWTFIILLIPISTIQFIIIFSMSISIRVGYSPPAPSEYSSSSAVCQHHQHHHHAAASHQRRQQIHAKIRAEQREFTEELCAKLKQLAMDHRREELNGFVGNWDDIVEEEDTLPPERMCEWMRMADWKQQQQRQPPLPPAIFGSQAVHHGNTFLQAKSTSSCDSISPENAASKQQSGSVANGCCLFHRGPCDGYGCSNNSSGFCSSESAATTVWHQGQRQQQQMVISYREFRGGPPFVVKTEPRAVTFREFRRLFGIPMDSNKRFLFKEQCEDGTAPFQWRVIDDEDSGPLPIFEGKISAECRTLSESSEGE